MKSRQQCEELQRRTEERIRKLQSQPNFLFVAEFKKKEDKKFLEDIMQKEAEEERLHHEYWRDGVLYIKRDSKIVDCIRMTMEQYIDRLVKEMQER